MSTSSRVLAALRLAYTGRPGQSTGRRVTQGALVGLFTLGVVGAAVSPETEKAASQAPAPVVVRSTAPEQVPTVVPSVRAATPPARAVAPVAPVATVAPVAPVAKPTTAPPKPAPRPTPKRTTPAPKPAASTCGAPANPWGYNFCGRGSYITSPPEAFCSYFDCIDSFWESTNGYVMQCDDGMYSHSGGRRGSCSHHGGNNRPLFG